MPERTGFPHDDFFKIPNAIFGSRKKPGWIDRIGIVGLGVYALVLRRYDHAKGGSIYESHAAMARVLGVSKTTVERQLSRLESFGLIDRRLAGKRKHPMWQYVPVIPIPPLVENGSDESNRPSAGVLNRPRGELKAERIDQLARKNRPVDELVAAREVDKIQPIKSCSTPPNRLFNRLDKNMCIETQVREVLTNLEFIPIRTQAQVGWRYWCHLWQEHYGRAYYLATCRDTARAVAKDKKNLRDKIEAVGFAEVIARMQRCFEVCDEVFPCVVQRKWVRPISLNDFVNNRFFDQWISLNQESEESYGKSVEEKLRAAREKSRLASGAIALEETSEVEA